MGFLLWTPQDLRLHGRLRSLLPSSNKRFIIFDITSRQFWNYFRMTLTMKIAWFQQMILTFCPSSSSLKCLQQINSPSHHPFSSRNYRSAWLLLCHPSQINSILWTKSTWMFSLITSLPNYRQAKTSVTIFKFKKLKKIILRISFNSRVKISSLPFSQEIIIAFSSISWNIS